jgi:hypothetical protein
LADAGFATGAGGAGASAVVGCGNSNCRVSIFVLPRNELFSPVNGTEKNTDAKLGRKSMYIPAQKWNKRITGVVFLKVTLRAGNPAGRHTVHRGKVRRQ